MTVYNSNKLMERVMNEPKRTAVLNSINDYYKIQVSDETIKDIENICYGTFSPLKGFMGLKDLRGVMDDMHLASSEPWTIPILLDIPDNHAKDVHEGDIVMLTDGGGAPSALMEIREKYSIDKDELCHKIFLTTDSKHPGVAKTRNMGNVFLGGDIEMIQPLNSVFKELNLRPRETRALFRENGWKTVVSFQTRNAPHNGHEYVQKAALTFTDGLFINPVIGKKKAGDFTDDVIIDTYRELIHHYYPKDRVAMSILPFEMRYAGPREAIFHAIIRKNYGCTHIIIGRDHAGVGNYYGPFDAHKIFDKFPDLGIKPFFFRSFFHCKKCGGVANDCICPHEGEHIINFAGTKMRKLLIDGKRPDELMMRPEVVDVILRSKKPFVE
ncbi:MAG: sulfate adenylyltransferase [Candidatus Thermoplasmatota archaeon]|jgi:sulfate adenylyltransferase|nr:sulfate adenylyltransferase [Candidatus Thermoplasmatota archaeon]